MIDDEQKCDVCGKVLKAGSIDVKSGKKNRSTKARVCSIKCRDRFYYIIHRYGSFEEAERQNIIACKHCGKEFLRKHGGDKYCSAECRDASLPAKVLGNAYACEMCGKKFTRTYADQKYCSAKCRDKRNKAWAKAREEQKRLKIERIYAPHIKFCTDCRIRKAEVGSDKCAFCGRR